jgi:hypothetical protein
MIDRLRDFVVGVPRELWPLNSNNLARTPALKWDPKEFSEHRSSYRGPVGQFYCSFDEGQVSLDFVVKSELPDSPSVFWGTTMSPLDLSRDVEDVRSEVIARISLEADPPIQLRYPWVLT